MPRGPSYPSIALDEAAGLIEKLHKFAGTQPVAVDTVLKDAEMLDSSVKSTGAIKKVAALKYFGLVEEIPGGNARQIKISKRAQQIRLNDGRAEALRDAFLSPKHYLYCWEFWGADLPSDAAIASHLILERKFIENTVGGFIANYRKSLEYSGILDAEGDGDKADPSGEQRDSPLVVGDFVQWESGGALQFPEPKQVTYFSDDGTHVYVEGSTAGIPVEQATKEDPPPSHASPLNTPQPLSAPPLARRASHPALVLPAADESAIHQATMTLAEGTVLLQWPSSLTEEGYEDFEAWVNLMLKRAKRSIVKSVDDGSD